MSHFPNKLLYKSQYPDMISALAGIVTPAKGGHRGKRAVTPRSTFHPSPKVTSPLREINSIIQTIRPLEGLMANRPPPRPENSPETDELFRRIPVKHPSRWHRTRPENYRSRAGHLGWEPSPPPPRAATRAHQRPVNPSVKRPLIELLPRDCSK